MPRAPADPFARIVGKLHEAYGEDMMQVGDPVEDATLVAIEKKLGIHLQNEHRLFIRQHGWLEAGPFSEIRVFGVVAKKRRTDFPVDLRAVMKLWRVNIEELSVNVVNVRTKRRLAALREVVPFYCGEMDYPWEDTAVFDPQGRIRIAHANPTHVLEARPLLDAPDPRPMAKFLLDVTRRRRAAM